MSRSWGFICQMVSENRRVCFQHRLALIGRGIARGQTCRRPNVRHLRSAPVAAWGNTSQRVHRTAGTFASMRCRETHGSVRPRLPATLVGIINRMTNLATSLKAEISRLARKEIRSELEDLKKATSQQRAHIASLRRQIDDLERVLKKASKAQRRPAASSESSEAGDGARLRFRASGLASHRNRLGLSAGDFGKLSGVSGQSVYKWETGEVKPRRAQLEAIASVRKIGRREALARLAQAQ